MKSASLSKRRQAWAHGYRIGRGGDPNGISLSPFRSRRLDGEAEPMLDLLRQRFEMAAEICRANSILGKTERATGSCKVLGKKA